MREKVHFTVHGSNRDEILAKATEKVRSYLELEPDEEIGNLAYVELDVSPEVLSDQGDIVTWNADVTVTTRVPFQM